MPSKALATCQALTDAFPTAKEIVRNIERREDGWTATAVLKAFIARAIVVHSAVNCITEGQSLLYGQWKRCYLTLTRHDA